LKWGEGLVGAFVFTLIFPPITYDQTQTEGWLIENTESCEKLMCREEVRGEREN